MCQMHLDPKAEREKIQSLECWKSLKQTIIYWMASRGSELNCLSVRVGECTFMQHTPSYHTVFLIAPGPERLLWATSDLKSVAMTNKKRQGPWVIGRWESLRDWVREREKEERGKRKERWMKRTEKYFRTQESMHFVYCQIPRSNGWTFPVSGRMEGWVT